MTQDNARTWIHQDVEITINESGQFQYTLDDQGHSHDTLSHAQEAITKYQLMKTRAETMNLSCLTRQGELFIIHGIHLNTSRVLTTPQDVHTRDECHVDTPLIRIMLEQAVYHEEKARSIRHQLVNTIVRTYGYGGRMRPERYPEAMEALLASYEEATEHAKNLEQPDA